MPKMHQNTFGRSPDPLGELICSPRLCGRNGGPTSDEGGEGSAYL